jgi:hypothetical protein
MVRSFSTPSSIAIAAASAVMAAASIGGLSAFLVSGVLQAKAQPQIETVAHQDHAKADRLSVLVKGAPCSAFGWPDYERKCQFDMRRPADERRTVRVIALR